MSNQVPTGKWNVAGWCVTCISNCVLGNSRLNGIDSWGIQHYAVHQPTIISIPFQRHLLRSDKGQNSFLQLCYQYLAQSQTSGNRNCTMLTLKFGEEVNKNTVVFLFFFRDKDWLLCESLADLAAGLQIHMNAIGCSSFRMANLHKSIQNALPRKMSVSTSTTWCLDIINRKDWET